jgi:hypothetical protein
MKEPVTTTPIEITVTHPGGDLWRAQANSLKATSTCGEESAALNLATRHFFGGTTNAEGVGIKERQAIVMTRIRDNTFRATLKVMTASAGLVPEITDAEYKEVTSLCYASVEELIFVKSFAENSERGDALNALDTLMLNLDQLRTIIGKGVKE